MPAKLKRRLLWSAGGLAGLLALAALAVVYWLRSSLPDYAGERKLAKLSGEIEIVRDAYAIPHIYANSAHDAYFGLGYVHAQDRLWQLELNRRVGSGTLAELVGERALESDRLFRTLGLRGLAEQTYAALDPETRDALQAYADGINAWLDERHTLPPEFGLLSCTPSAWRPADSVLFGKLLAWQLSGNWSDELRRVRLGRQLSAQQLSEFAPPYPGSEPIPFAQLWQVYDALQLESGRKSPTEHTDQRNFLRALAPIAAVLAPLAPADFGQAIGSNNWVVDGTRTQTHKPLLANDPHLALSAPSQWYFAQLEAPGLHVIGATLPASAGVILGHNAQVAWAFTNTHPDSQDVFVERLVPGDEQYETPEGPRRFERRRERIAVRGAEPVELAVRATRHGPVISDVSEEAQGLLPEGYVLALSWTALRTDDTTAAFPLRAAAARNAAELRDAARSFHTPTQNIVYADAAGAVGFVAAGRLPVRKPENALKGLVPAPGWLADYDWTGVLPFEELPQQSAPANGQIVTANQNIASPEYAHWLGADWGPPYRHDRIGTLLDAQPTHTIASFEAIARDRTSRIAQLLTPAMLRVLGAPNDAGERRESAALARWDREMRPDASEPLLFAAWLRELSRLIYADELGPLFEDEWLARPEFILSVLDDREGQARWCDDRRTAEVEACPALARRALHAALAYLRGRFGPDRAQWTWAAAHPSVSAHRLLGPLPVIGRWFDVAAVRGGDASTVDAAGYRVADEQTAFRNHWGPGFRAIYDLADFERSVAILNTGQSGHFLSPHYRDMNGAWARGEYLPLHSDRTAIERGALGTLRLRPR